MGFVILLAIFFKWFKHYQNTKRVFSWLSPYYVFRCLLRSWGRMEGVKFWYCSYFRDQDAFFVVLYTYTCIPFFPFPFCTRVIHALLCTSLASPSVFKRLLRWENEIGTSFLSENSALVSWRHRAAGKCVARNGIVSVSRFVCCVCCCSERHTTVLFKIV